MPKIIFQEPSFTFQKTPPVLAQENLISLLEYDRKFLIPEMTLFEVQNGELFEDGSIFENKRLLPDSLRDPKMKDMYTFSRLLRRRLSYKKTKLDNDIVFSLLDHWGHEYYHWFAESLPRLEFALSYVNDLTVVLSERYLSKTYISESLKRYPIKSTLIHKRQILRNNKILYSTFPGPSDFHRGHLLKSVRQRLGSQNPKPPFRKVYLSRSKARYRKILNEDMMFKCLEELGFQKVFSEDLTWLEQQKLFEETRILIANHGAGLTNLLFMQPESCVIEIRKDRYGILDDGTLETSKFYNTYYHMAQALNIKYATLPSPSPEPKLSCHYADVTVDIPTLEKIIAFCS